MLQRPAVALSSRKQIPTPAHHCCSDPRTPLQCAYTECNTKFLPLYYCSVLTQNAPLDSHLHCCSGTKFTLQHPATQNHTPNHSSLKIFISYFSSTAYHDFPKIFFQNNLNFANSTPANMHSQYHQNINFNGNISLNQITTAIQPH